MRRLLLLLQLGLILGGCAPFESRFLRPPRTVWRAPERAEVLEIAVPDSGTIRAWMFHPQPRDTARTPVLIMAHGRSDSMADYRTFAPHLADAIGCAVVLYDYRGFGASSDLENPTRRSMTADGSAVLHTVARHPSIDPDRIALMGVSLGAYAAAASFADVHNARALVLWGAPADIKMLIADGHGELDPVTRFAARLLVPRDREPERSLADAGRRPILIAHARADAIVRIEHAYRLRQAAPHAELIIDEQGSHTQISETTLDAIIDFVRSNLTTQPSGNSE